MYRRIAGKIFRYERASVAVVLLLMFILTLAVNAFADEQEDYSGYLGYSCLTTEGSRAIYIRLREALEMMEEKVFIPADMGCTADEIKAILESLFGDFPEYFYVLYFFVNECEDGSGYLAEFIWGLNYSFATKDEVVQARSAVEGSICKFLSSVPADVQTDYDKALYTHDYLIENVAYLWEGDHQSVYGALVEGKSVCAGYGKAYVVLMRRLGIKTWYVTGKTKSGQKHGWNISWIDGECVYTDVTWDDKGDAGADYRYFNISGEEMNRDHDMDEEFRTILPYCTHSSHAYRPVTAASISLSDSFISLKQAGASVCLTAQIYPENTANKDLKFTSSDPAVAIVDTNGVITAVGEGTAVILVNSADGGATASCTVVVADLKPEPIPETIPTITEQTISIPPAETVDSQGEIIPDGQLSEVSAAQLLSSVLVLLVSLFFSIFTWKI